MVRKLFEGQKANQSVEGSLDVGFNLGQVFHPKAKALPHWITQGAVTKINLNLWSGLHEMLGKWMEKLGNQTEESND